MFLIASLGVQRDRVAVFNRPWATALGCQCKFSATGSGHTGPRAQLRESRCHQSRIVQQGDGDGTTKVSSQSTGRYKTTDQVDIRLQLS